MDRRGFLRCLASAPLLATPAIAGTLGTVGVGSLTRISCVKGDPGERAYAMACGDGLAARIFVDGVEVKLAKTADVTEGWVRRAVTTEKGNVAINLQTGEVMEETVYGRVEIRLVPRKPADMYRKFTFDRERKVEVPVHAF